MNLAQHKEIIKNRFEAYESLQNSHLDMLKKDVLPNLNALTTERKQASSALQTVLNRFMENAGSLGRGKSIDLLAGFESRLSKIMALDERISVEIQRHRRTIKKELVQMKQGKTAMMGYKSAVSTPQSPRVFSISR